MKHTIYVVSGAIAFALVVLAAYFALSWVFYDYEPDPRAPTFTCAQTISPDSAAILSADLWNRAQRNERTRVWFGCRDGITFIRLERVR